MKYFTLPVLLLVLLSGCIKNEASQNPQDRSKMPPPTQKTTIKWDMEEGGKSKARSDWMKQMHTSAPEDNWRELELKNSLVRQKSFASKLSNRNGGDQIEDIGNGLLSGIWHEKGSNNQAGSVKATTYDPDTDELYTIAAGGSIFKSKRGQDNWTVVHEHIVFDEDILELINFNGNKRLIASANAIPMYSEDMGITWKMSTGISSLSSWANTYNCIVDGENDPNLYVLTKPDYWDPLFVMRSSDGGASWQMIRSLGNNETAKFWMTAPERTSDIYLFDNINDERTDIYAFDQASSDFILIESSTTMTFAEVPTNAQAVIDDGQLIFLAYGTGDRVKVSKDTCKTWSPRGVVPERPWSRRFYAFPSNPSVVLAGGVELYRGTNEGFFWEKHAEWWEYYDDIPGKLHADMMYFREFYAPDTEEYFTIVANHGGMSMTTDYGETYQNIGMAGLNVSQYYSVRTDPNDPSVMYAGAQDQGFQRGVDFGDDTPSDFDQVISGDYGHIVFSENGQRLWTVYPGGDVSYYNNPITDSGPTRWFSVESEDESVWIPPMHESPFDDENVIYLAGGNANGGPGSYLIKLEYNENFGSIESEQIDFDFLDNGGSVITAIEFSPMDANVIYVGLQNGRFFASQDGGETWKESTVNGPAPQYLYGQAIFASKTEPGVVYFGGSGYSNPAAYASEDFGATFRAIESGLPPTLMTGLVGNDDGSLLFASTESGPYVFDVVGDVWHSLAGANAPSTRYWSVEFLSDEQRVRFGTYGRGIWDFALQESVSTKPDLMKDDSWTIYPNPVAEMMTIELKDDGLMLANYDVKTLDGRLILSGQLNQLKNTIDVSHLPSGQYLIHLKNEARSGAKILIKQ